MKEIILPGLILRKEQAELIANGKQTAFIKSEDFRRLSNKELFLVSGEDVFARIKVSASKSIQIKEFKELEPFHLVSEEKRKRIYPGKRRLYFYRIKLLEVYKPLLEAVYENGARVFSDKVEAKMRKKRGKPKRARTIPEPQVPDETQPVRDSLSQEDRFKEVTHPDATRLSDIVPDMTDDEIYNALEGQDGDGGVFVPEEKKQIKPQPVRQYGKGTLGSKVQQMRNLTKSKVVIAEPREITNIREENRASDIVEKFKKLLRERKDG